ncbi:MAG: hypothetical protein ACFFAH_16750 [Promethearchaeota archaeon]
MIISSPGCYNKYYKTYLKVDPDSIDINPSPTPTPSGGDDDNDDDNDEYSLEIFGFFIIGAISASIILAILIRKRFKR